MPAAIVPEEIQDNMISVLMACQNGVMRMIPTVPDTVETSSNLAIVTIGGGKADVRILARSSCDTMKDFLADSLTACFSMAGMKVELSGSYSGWQPNVDSPILHAMTLSYKQQFGVEPAVKVIHAGLECGIIGANCPGLDMISFGPTLRSPHSPDERAYIPSVTKFMTSWLLLWNRLPKSNFLYHNNVKAECGCALLFLLLPFSSWSVRITLLS